MPTVAPELTSKPPHMVLFNNDGVGGVKMIVLMPLLIMMY